MSIIWKNHPKLIWMQASLASNRSKKFRRGSNQENFSGLFYVLSVTWKDISQEPSWVLANQHALGKSDPFKSNQARKGQGKEKVKKILQYYDDHLSLIYEQNLGQ